MANPCFHHFISLQAIFVYLLIVLTSTASLSSHEKECAALFQFKQTSILHQDHDSFNDALARGSHKFDSWKKMTSNASYSGESDCCLWDGVMCSNTGDVIGLDLSRSFLHGPINSNSTLFNLVHLQMLNLSMNDFAESQIPSQIASLKQLRSLDLSASGFSGQIPKEISHLIHMSSLDLSLNSLKLQSPSLEFLLQNFTRLEELHLSGVDISSSIPHFLANFSSIRSIKLQDCQLHGEFPSPILHLPKLKHLNMAINRNLTGSLPEFQNNTILEHLDLLSTAFGGTIPESISNLDHLVFLALGESPISGHIPGSLSNMTQLTKLSLRSSDLTGPIPSLARLSKLIGLELSFNSFEEGRLQNLIGEPTNLEILSLNGANIHDEIPPSLANLTKLRVVSMPDNFIYGRIPSSFMNLTQLRVLDLGVNQLQGQISSAFSNLKSLQYLYLDSNKFSGKVELKTFIGLDKLEEFSLNSNKITFITTNNYTTGILPELKFLGLSSCNLAEFPGFLRYLKKLTGLFLLRNKIRGLIPEWVWNSSQETLQMIDLSYNFITGFHQQPRFIPWVNLEAFVVPHNKLQGQIPVPPPTMIYFDVSNNNLTGEIPPLICEVKSLQLLALSSNKMTGSLPPCLGNLSNSLLVLDLKQNQFHGTMMNTFTQGNTLKWIDLSENRFTGQVPKSLTNCSNLQVLSLGENSFNDVFPFWLGSLPELQVLTLTSNKFYGVIQGPTVDSSHFSKLRIIDLSNNGFNGQLPENLFQIWNAMKSANVGDSYAMTLFTDFDGLQKDYSYSMTFTNKGVKTQYEHVLNIFKAIDLSSNNFEGQIPQALQDFQGLESLNLSNNHLTGRVFPSLGNLKSLEALDLSNNELSGEIPQELLQLGFLAMLNVSFNNLYGPIPKGKQFNTFQNNSYIGNPRLCGEPLSRQCQVSTVLPPTSYNKPVSNESESLLPSDIIDWIVISLGVVSGLVVGIIFGRSGYATDRLINRFNTRKDRWVRPLRNARRN